jgi:hypothetical protein
VANKMQLAKAESATAAKIVLSTWSYSCLPTLQYSLAAISLPAATAFLNTNVRQFD